MTLRLEDNGGGHPSTVNAASGHRILGIRERIAALGGSLSTGWAAKGISVAAVIPLASTRPASVMASGSA